MAMSLRAPAYDRLLAELGKLPGIGPRSAERIALHLLKRPAEEPLALAEALRDFCTNLKVCSITGMVSESDPWPVAIDPKRDHSLVLVVEQPSDVIAIEQAGTYRGSYHVLMGRLAPLDAVRPGDLNIDGLIRRVRQGGIREVILGTNPTLEGDGTALFLSEKLAGLGVTVTRLARGMPTGQSLDSVSKAVLADALSGRRPMEDESRPAGGPVTIA